VSLVWTPLQLPRFGCVLAPLEGATSECQTSERTPAAAKHLSSLFGYVVVLLLLLGLTLGAAPHEPANECQAYRGIRILFVDLGL
jgi:hypothetical protein